MSTAQLMPVPLTVSCFSKIQIGFTFLVPAHPCSPGQRAVKRVCVCVCLLNRVRGVRRRVCRSCVSLGATNLRPDPTCDCCIRVPTMNIVQCALRLCVVQHALVVIRSLAATNLLSHFLTIVAIAAPSRHNPTYAQLYSLCRTAGNGSTELTGHLN